MPHHNVACECDAFYCYPISSMTREDTIAVKGFAPVHQAGAGVVEYLQQEAYRDEQKGLMRTYLVRAKYTDEFVGFFSLKAGLVSTRESDNGGESSFDTLPSVEVAYLAIDQHFRDRYPETEGCGLIVFEQLIMPIIRRAAGLIGISRVYIFSLDEERLVENYRGYGFLSLSREQEESLHRRLKPRGLRGCKFMYMKL